MGWGLGWGWGAGGQGEHFRLPLPLQSWGTHVWGASPEAHGLDSASPGVLGHSSPAPHSPLLLSSLDLFFRWLFDKKFLAEAAIRFE